MSDIWIDPVELRSTAALLGQQAKRIQDTAVGVADCCGMDAPRSVVAWIDEALVAVTEDALRVAVAFVTQAVDLAQRADEVVTEEAVDTTTGTATQVDPATAIIMGGSVVGGTGPAFTTDLPADGVSVTSTIGGGGPGWSSTMPAEGLGLTATVGQPTWSDFPLMQALQQRLQGVDPGSQLHDDLVHNAIDAFPGMTMHNGQWEDSSGRVGTPRPDPDDPGRYRA